MPGPSRMQWATVYASISRFSLCRARAALRVPNGEPPCAAFTTRIRDWIGAGEDVDGHPLGAQTRRSTRTGLPITHSAARRLAIRHTQSCASTAQAESAEGGVHGGPLHATWPRHLRLFSYARRAMNPRATAVDMARPSVTRLAREVLNLRIEAIGAIGYACPRRLVGNATLPCSAGPAPSSRCGEVLGMAMATGAPAVSLVREGTSCGAPGMVPSFFAISRREP